MVQYSLSAKRLYSIFFQYRNDIDIYTEDEEKDREFYRCLFTRLLEGTGITINDVTPLGCKENVINRCLNEPPSKRRKLFIVDGDIELIADANSEEIENLYVLGAYCIENLIIDETSATEFLYMNLGTASKENTKKQLNFDDWLSRVAEALIELFFHFSIVKEIGLNFTLYNANRFMTNSEEKCIDIDMVKAYVNKLKEEILSIISDQDYNRKLNDRKSRWTISNDTVLTIVSGKDYLLPMLQFRVQNLKKIKGLYSTNAIKLNLAKHCELERLQDLRMTVLAM